MATSKKSERGASLILFSMIATFVLIPIVGLAIDGSVLYWEKARLSASVDAAALATGRALNTSQALTTQLSAVQAVGQNYFLADFAPGHMRTTLVTPVANLVSIDQSQASVIVVTVQATITVPLFFARIFGSPTTNISDIGQATRRDLNVVFVIDRSGSMAGGGGTECSDLKNAINDVVTNYFIDGRDNLELITFQTTASVDWGAGTHFVNGTPSMPSTVSQLVCNGGTNISMALSMAHQAITAMNGPLKLNIIIFFTDGVPTALRIGGSAAPNKVMIASGSGCKSTDNLYGVLTMPGQTPNDFGPNYGLFLPTPVSISSNASTTTTPGVGCAFPSDYTSVANDVAYIPSLDYYNNGTNNGYIPFPVNPPTVLKTGFVRADTNAGVMYASYNSADAAGSSIRQDSTYNPVIYTIGLGSSVNSSFLQRLANDPNSSTYNSNLASGEYVYAANSSQLDSAFRQIVSQVLSLSK